MNYQESLAWLGLRSTLDFDKGVERVAYLLDKLGNPQLSLPTVHFVGTNGKGSTLNALSFILRESGYKVGRFTSPSIIDFREQIVYEEEMIAEEVFAAIVTDLLPDIADMDKVAGLGSLSEFEIVVVAMFVYFASYHKPDILLVEAGMGGLLDATNVLTPLVVACPSIGLDHQAFLGETYAAIAQHKVGVLREGVPLVYATDHAEVSRVFEDTAARLHSKTYAFGREIVVKDSRAGLSVQTPFARVERLHLSMKGVHQKANAALAVTCAQLLSNHFPNISETSIRQGLATAVWPGRQELLAPSLLIDGAHNTESIAALIHRLREDYADREIFFLFAAIHTKPVASMLAQLDEIGSVTVTTFDDERAVGLDGYPKAYPSVADFRDWLDQVELTDPSKLYVVTGSLYFITFVRKYSLEKLL